MHKWAVQIREGKIASIVKEEDVGHIVDYGEAVVMPGLIDV
jgi:cytosine/adenosine deaminase-related metal-dependent hydrolase